MEVHMQKKLFGHIVHIPAILEFSFFMTVIVSIKINIFVCVPNLMLLPL